MDASGKDRSNHPNPYPRNVDEWRDAISKALNLLQGEGKARYLTGTFPFNDLISWIRREFSASKGYSSDFVPALTRNIKGLVAWVFGGSSEPYWPGRDED